MCLAIPSRITKIENNMATIDVEGVQREASLLLLEDARVGDYVIVHAGFAISKLDQAAADDAFLEFLRRTPVYTAFKAARRGRDWARTQVGRRP